MHVRISEEAHDAWMRFCADQGVTLTGFLEVTGQRGPLSVLNPKVLSGLLVEVRELDHERRAAGGPRRSV